MFNSSTKKSPAEITNFPDAEEDDERPLEREHQFSSDAPVRRTALPGPAAEDPNALPSREGGFARRQSFDEDTRLADNRGLAKNRPAITKSTAKNTPNTVEPPAQLSNRTFATVLILILFASIGGNLFLGWLARDFYWRYRDLAWEMRGGGSSAT